MEQSLGEAHEDAADEVSFGQGLHQHLQWLSNKVFGWFPAKNKYVWPNPCRVLGRRSVLAGGAYQQCGS
jgi:hypothetical protein